MVPDTPDGYAFNLTLAEVEEAMETALSTHGDDLATVAESCASRLDDWAVCNDELAAEALYTQAYLYTAAFSFTKDSNPLLAEIAESKLGQLSRLSHQLGVHVEFELRAAILYHMLDEARGLGLGGQSVGL